MARRAKTHGKRGQSPQKGFFLRREKRQQKMRTMNFKTSLLKSSGLYVVVGLLVMLLAFVAVTFYLITNDSRNEQEWIRLATDLQVQSQQLTKSASEAVEGNSQAFFELGDSSGAIAGSMAALKNGMRSNPCLLCQTFWQRTWLIWTRPGLA